MSKGKGTKIISKMGSKEGFDKENQNPITEKDAKASSTTANVVPDDLPLTKVRSKTTTKVPPRLTIRTSAMSSSSPLSPTAEEFHLPQNISALPSTNLSNLLSTLAITPPFSPHLPPPSAWPHHHHQHHNNVTALVEQPGFISLRLRHGVVLDLSANMAIRLTNTAKNSSISVSACTTQMALVHPMGRMLQYGPRVEVQSEDHISVKNAKIYPRGISFTANNMALVYLLDEAGARSTSDMFHDLYATQIADTLFNESCQRNGVVVSTSIQQLDKTRYWRTDGGVDCWVIGNMYVQQTEDGFVIVEREVQQGDRFILRTSPSNGKIRCDSRFLQTTASLGEESHMFVRSMDRRLHYSGQTKVFTVRNAGHSAGFDEEGSLRIF